MTFAEAPLAKKRRMRRGTGTSRFRFGSRSNIAQKPERSETGKPSGEEANVMADSDQVRSPAACSRRSEERTLFSPAPVSRASSPTVKRGSRPRGEQQR